MTTFTDSPAMLAALAKIEADGKAFAAMRNRVQADPRYARLTAYSKSLEQEITGSGWDGLDQLVGQCTSSQYWRSKRAGDLAQARKGQVKGMPGYAKFWLREAARHRKTELMYRAAEKPPISLAMATEAFCGLLSATPSLHAAE